MELKIYNKHQEAEKTLTCDNYDLRWGTVEDMISIISQVEDMGEMSEEEATEALFRIVRSKMQMIKELLKDMFPKITEEDLRKLKTKDIVMVIAATMYYVKQTFIGNDSPN